MKCTTTEDHFKALQTVMPDVKIDFSKLTVITTNGALVMVGQKKRGFFPEKTDKIP